MPIYDIEASDEVALSEATSCNKSTLLEAIDGVALSEFQVTGHYFASDTVVVSEEAILSCTKTLNASDEVAVRDRGNRAFELDATDSVGVSEIGSRGEAVSESLVVSEEAEVLGGPKAKDSLTLTEQTSLGQTKQLSGVESIVVTDAATVYNRNKTKIYSPT